MKLDSVLFLLFDRLGFHELFAVRGACRELRALASDDHAWTDAFRSVFETFKLGEDDLKVPAYPIRAHGQERDWAAFFPGDAESVELAGLVLCRYGGEDPVDPPTTYMTLEGVLEDLFYPSSEAAPFDRRRAVYKARHLPLRCELCDVECDSYASFTAHCLLKAHKVLLDPSKRFDPRFEDTRFRDPRHTGDSFDALPTMAKFVAMQRYHATVFDFLTAPMDHDGLENMLSYAEMARGCVKLSADILQLSAREVRSINRDCTAERAAAVWLLCFVLADFKEGLTGYALDVVRHGWGALDTHDIASDQALMSCITGLPF